MKLTWTCRLKFSSLSSVCQNSLNLFIDFHECSVYRYWFYFCIFLMLSVCHTQVLHFPEFVFCIFPVMFCVCIKEHIALTWLSVFRACIHDNQITFALYWLMSDGFWFCLMLLHTVNVQYWFHFCIFMMSIVCSTVFNLQITFALNWAVIGWYFEICSCCKHDSACHSVAVCGHTVLLNYSYRFHS